MTNINILKTLSKLESSYNAAEVFKYKETSSWVNVKNYLYVKSLAGKISDDKNVDFFSKNGVYLFFLSLIHYIKLIFSRNENNLYVGAGSGLFNHNHQTLDSYLPFQEVENNELSYMLSAEHPDKLILYLSYLKKNNVVIYSFLLAPLKAVFTKLFYKFTKLSIDKDFFDELESNGLSVNLMELSYIHTRFIVSVYLYKIFLSPLKITKAYIVSAYSNSEIISVLRDNNIETVELQHGLIGSTHRAYNYKCKSQLIPTPDKIFVYNEFWKNELLNAGYYQDSQIKITGRLKYDLITPEIEVHNKSFIVFTGQGGFYDDILEFFRCSNDFLLTNKVDLFYIPHPNETDKTIGNLRKQTKDFDSIFIISDKQYTTEQYIYNSLSHISVYSSCHFDAIHYKNQTYVLDVMKDNPMQYYFDLYPVQYKMIKSITAINLTS